MSLVRVDLQYRAGYSAAGANSRVLPAAQANTIVPFQALPLFIEENSFFYNGTANLEGFWGNLDQVGHKHFKKGHMAFLDGGVALMNLPNGSNEQVAEATDFTANWVFINTRQMNNSWYAISDGAYRFGVPQPFGWINNPR